MTEVPFLLKRQRLSKNHLSNHPFTASTSTLPALFFGQQSRVQSNSKQIKTDQDRSRQIPAAHGNLS